jgi:hypothetical protein
MGPLRQFGQTKQAGERGHSMMHTLHRRWKLGLLAIGFALVMAGVAYAAIPDGSGVIHGCYTNKGGILSVIDPSAGQTCSSLQTPLRWNQQGPKGDTGPQGPQGDPGPQGPSGISHADERFFFRSLTDPGTWLPIVSGTWPDVRPFLTHVLTMHLDKGNYAITAEVIAENDSGQGIVVCLLGNSTVGFTVAQSAVGNAGGFALQQTFEAQGIFTLDAASDLELSCFNATQNAPGTPRIGWADVVATKVDTVTSTQE